MEEEHLSWKTGIRCNFAVCPRVLSLFPWEEWDRRCRHHCKGSMFVSDLIDPLLLFDTFSRFQLQLSSGEVNRSSGLLVREYGVVPTIVGGGGVWCERGGSGEKRLQQVAAVGGQFWVVLLEPVEPE